jgi:hypothetical protein
MVSPSTTSIAPGSIGLASAISGAIASAKKIVRTNSLVMGATAAGA